MVINVNQVNPADQVQQNQQADNSSVAQELRKIEDIKKAEQQLDARAYDKIKNDAKRLDALSTEKGYQAKLQKDPAIKILSSLATDLAKIGVLELSSKAMGKTSGKIDSEMEKAMDKIGNLREDKYEINRNMTRDAVKRAHTKEEREKSEEKDRKDAKQLLNSDDVKEAIQQYSGAYAQFAVAASPAAREKLEDAQDSLRKKGFSEREIGCLEKAVKKSFGREFSSNIQDSFIQHMFSPKNTFQFVVTSRKMNNAFKDAMASQQLSGISNDPSTVQDEMKKIVERSHEELKDFIRDAVESKLMERHISGIDNRKDVKKLVDLGNKVHFNFDTFLKTWQQKKFDLGLFILEIDTSNQAQNNGEISIGEVKSGGVGDKHGYEMNNDEERALLVNQLRAEMFKRALTGDPLAQFSFVPKIRKLKNGLIKLGLETEDFNRIEKEGKVLARYRTLEMLRSAFVERATYYEHSGPAWNLLKNKTKGLISNLERLDMKLTREELEVVRDDANRQMHDNAVNELKSAVAVLENMEHPSLEKKVPLMVKLIQKLREESGFENELGEDVDETIFRHENDLKELKEDA